MFSPIQKINIFLTYKKSLAGKQTGPLQSHFPRIVKDTNARKGWEVCG